MFGTKTQALQLRAQKVLPLGVNSNFRYWGQGITPYVDRAIAEIDPVERAILRLGAFELEFHLEIPYRVVLNEAVELAKTYGAEHGHKYINAVLDKVALNVRPLEVNGSGRSA